LHNQTDSSICMDLVTRFYRHLDLREYEKLDALMARDGSYLRPSGRTLLAGPPLIADLAAGSKTLTLAHLLTNLYVDFNGDEASLHGYMTVFQHDSGAPPVFPLPLGNPTSIRAMNITLHRREGGWRIWKLNNVLLFRAG
jgi:SnoaL-like domain